jgi:hypothetical protein
MIYNTARGNWLLVLDVLHFASPAGPSGPVFLQRSTAAAFFALHSDMGDLNASTGAGT